MNATKLKSQNASSLPMQSAPSAFVYRKFLAPFPSPWFCVMTRAQGHSREDKCKKGWIKHPPGPCWESVSTAWVLCQANVPSFDVEESPKPTRGVFVSLKASCLYSPWRCLINKIFKNSQAAAYALMIHKHRRTLILSIENVNNIDSYIKHHKWNPYFRWLYTGRHLGRGTMEHSLCEMPFFADFHDLSRLVIRENKSQEADEIWKARLLKYISRTDDTDGTLLCLCLKFQLCAYFFSPWS